MRSRSRRLTGGASALRRHWVLSGGVVLVLVVATGTWLTFRPAAAEPTTLTSTVTSGTFTTSVSASGTITPARSQELTFPSGGAVTSVRVAVGDKVTQGEVLARMDASALAAQRDAAVATLDAAQTQLAEDLDASASATQLTADRASVASATSQLASARSAVAGATLLAPFSGRVSAVGVAVGDSTGASGQSTGATSDASSSGITVISTASYELDATVGSADISQLKKGMQAAITPTGTTQQVFGVVQSIGVIAQSTTGTTTSSSAAEFPVTIRVTGSTKGLYAGSSATATITVKQVTNVLTVPTRAVTSSGGKTYVTLVRNGKHVKTAIMIGQTFGAQTEVTVGVKAGDVVLLGSFTPPTGSGGSTGNRQGAFPQGGQGGTGGFGGFGGAPQ